MRVLIRPVLLTAIFLWVGTSQSLPAADRIAFTGERQGNSGLYVMDLDGSNVVKVGGWGFFSPSWVSGGRQLVACIGQGHLVPAGIYVLDVDAKVSPVLIEPDGAHPQCSLDGRKVVYETVRTSPIQMRTINLDGTDSVPLLSEAGGSAPSWSPDGGKIVYIHFRDDLGGGLWTMNADGTNQELMMRVEGGSAIGEPKWSPRGDKIVFTLFAPGALPDICVVDISEGTPVNLTNSPEGWEGSPSWSPDGRRIIFSRMDGVNFGSSEDGLDDGLWTMDEKGADWVLLLSLSNPEISGGDDAAWWGSGLSTLIQSLSWGEVKATPRLGGKGLAIPAAKPK